MPHIHRRRILQGIALSGLASAGCSGESSSSSSSSSGSSRNLSGWTNGGEGTLPRKGIEPPVGFSFPIRTSLPFAHGVASGDPLPDRVIIWTRITLIEYPATDLVGEWRMASDPDMKEIVGRGTFSTHQGVDWTIKLDVDGLSPYTVYYYQFFYDGAESCIGRTRTAPESWQDELHLRFAVCACSSYYSGHMNGYGRIAEKKDLDFVIHCGDYIYDFPDEDELIRIPSDNDDGETNEDFRNPLTMNELRRRYALYRSDPNLFRAHQQHPWLIIWDNHDIGGRDDLTDEESYRVFWEWTPSRQPDPEDLYRRHERLSYGSMADIFFTDRHYPKWYEEESQEDRTYLGVSQNEYLREELLNSKERDADWRILINQAFFGQLYLINPPKEADWLVEKFFPGVDDGIILNDNQWDGAPQERADFLNFLQENDIHNNLFVTGDMHMNWASDLAVDPGTPSNYNPSTGEGSVAIEFAPSSISRGGADETIRGILGTELALLATAASTVASNFLSTTNPNCQYLEWSNHGYGIVDMKPDHVTLEFWWTRILSHATTERMGAQLLSVKGSNHIQRLDVMSPTTRDSEADKPLADEVPINLLFQVV
ncbi:MAG: alkaline phosphatase D family protein [Pseudomonadales bacterium]|nr:alkaline phosphatase D family protein [Pseudomonadales bacterium]